MNLHKHIILICAIFLMTDVYSQTIGAWNVTQLKQTPSWTTTNVSAEAGMTGILYESIDYLGNPVEVFAYYSAPSGTPPTGGWPAVIFVSGGNGDAFHEAVEYWNDRGYAAISMDTHGDFPNGFATPNPGPGRDGVFSGWASPIENQWYYHAVAQVIKAHSLIRSFSEVNANKIGIMGASWGGSLTGTVMGLDNRLAWALPIYGCGYLDGSDGSQGDNITSGTGAKGDFVMANYDGSLFFNNVTFPTLFLNRMRDSHFDMSQNQKSSQAVQSPSGLIFIKSWGHGNLNWTELEEPYAFAESVVNGGDALPNVGTPYIISGTGYVTATSSVGISSASMHYTNDGDNVELNEKNWVTINASVSGNTVSANIPASAEMIIFEIQDSRGLIKSSEYLFTDDLTPPPGGSDNLALNGAADQSDTLNGRGPELAIDGNTNGNYGSGSVTASLGPNAWWEVDLGDEYSIDDINVFNRTNSCCVNRLSNFTVLVKDSNGTVTYSETITSAPNPSRTVDAGGATGQFVRIESNTGLTLNLAEVEVFGSESTNTKQDQTITFSNMTKQVGDADFDPATASSGYNISYTSSNTNVATIVSGNIRIVGVGTSQITASQAGNVVYNAAPSVTRTLTVTAGNTGGTTNLALNGTADQSDTLSGRGPELAIDGNTNGNFSGGSVTASAGPTAWWEVDLGGSYSIDDINVFNRTNSCCVSRLSNFTVLVKDSNGNVTYSETITSAPNPSETIDANGTIGQFVRIQSNLTSTLNLAEVEVFGSAAASCATFSRIQAENYNSMSGVVDEGINIGFIQDGDWAMYSNIDLTCANSIDVRASSNTSGGSIEVRLGSPTGTLIGTVSISNTGGWGTYTTSGSTISSVSGTHNVYLVFNGGSGYLFNVNWLEFDGTSSSKASSEKATLDLETSDADGILYAFPNPVKDILNVKISGSKTAKLDVINFAG